MAKKRRKRLVARTDGHSGHLVGLTPPPWWFRDDSEQQKKIHKIQTELWEFYAKTIDSLKPIDVLMDLGDLIDGKGWRSGGGEQKTLDRLEQCEMAQYSIEYAEAPINLLHFGTRYHTGMSEDFERVIAKGLLDNPKIKEVHLEGHSFPKINGLQFDAKHKIGGSTIPHGRFTAIAKDKLWNTIWNSRAEQQPKANVLLRGHVHYLSVCQNPAENWLAMTLPALQGYGSSYGVRECSGTVDIGLVVFDIEPDGSYTWWPILAKLPQQKVRPLPL